MRITRRYILPLVSCWLVGLSVVVGLVACSSDAETAADDDGDVLQISAGTRAAAASVEISGADAEGSSIFIFTTTTENVTPKADNAVLIDSKWRSTIRVNAGKTYYLYGFMPMDASENPTIDKLTGKNYDKGAVLSLSNVDAIGPKDLCVLIGVQDKANLTDPKDLKRGIFQYVGKERGQNYTHLLFSHVYASIVVKLKVDADYNTLRTIVLREMRLTSTSGKSKYNITMTVTANDTDTNPAEVVLEQVESSASNPTFALYEDVDGDAEDGLTLTSEAKEFPAFFATQTWGGMTLVTTYDVYDKQGTLVRPNCTVRNNLTTPLTQPLNAGEKLTLTATVKPTYLYQLSDSDMDDTKITITAN